MKRIMMVLMAVCSPVYGGIADDGFITNGEYSLLSITWRSYAPPLIVEGGGANEISVRDNGCLIVKSTATPLQRYGPGGVYDILLGNTAQLVYLGGVTEFIGIGPDATAILKGGNINHIKTLRYAAPDDENIFIYAKKDSWSWIDGDPLKGIKGKWLADGLDFRIEFINDNTYGFDPVWMSVKVIPEPTTMLMLGLGSLFVNRRKK